MSDGRDTSCTAGVMVQEMVLCWSVVHLGGFSLSLMVLL